MRIATWNVESSRKLTPRREAAFHKAMAEVDADVWVLTETWTAFSPGTGYQLLGQSQNAVDLNRRPDRCWVSIWAKASIRGTAQETHSQQDRLSCCRIELPGQHRIVVAGTVLPWNSDQLWPGENGFCASLIAQTAEWETLRGEPHATLIVAGDFNQSIPHEQWYGSRRCEEALNGVFENLDLMCLTRGNCPLANRPRIDHICVSRSVLDLHRLPQVGDWTIPSINGKPVTDHSGVYVDLESKSSP